MTSVRLRLPAFFALLLLLLSSAVAQAQLVPYDSFSGAKLDGDKWIGRQFVTREDGTGSLLEIQREITPVETLVLEARSVGGHASNTGVYSAENALLFRHSRRWSDISFVVGVRAAEAIGCAVGVNAEVSARGVYPLFNDGTGDVIAIAEVRRVSGSTSLDVVASLVLRSDAGEEVLQSVWLGSAELNSRVRLRVKWDEARSVVRFNRDAEVAAVLSYTNAVVSDAQSRKYLGARTSVPDCTSGDTTAAITAQFNNVRVNQ